VNWPFLSLYIDGCVQGLHNDARSGRFGFVYPLTRDDRKTVRGDAPARRETDYFRSTSRAAAAALSFYDLIEPRFNRLLIFDNRLLHGVTRVDSPMDRPKGCFVLQGHLSEVGTIVDGALPPALAVRPISMTRSRLPAVASIRKPVHHFQQSPYREQKAGAADRRRGGAKGVDDQPAGVVGAADPVGHRPHADLAEIEYRVFVDGSHEPDIRSGAGVEAEAGVRFGRGCRTVFSKLTRPPRYKVAGHLKSAKSCDASGLATLPVWIS
jgi:hypothetical protein